MKKLDALTGIRLLAALHVLAFHCFAWESTTGFVHDVVGAGYLGVGLFFVLSGFILSYNYGGRQTTPREFWKARFARIYPVYALSIVVAAPLFLSVNGIHRAPLVGGSRLLLIQSWFPGIVQGWNTPSWSLSVEGFFYLLFPLLIPFISKLNPSSVKSLFWAAIGLGLVAPALFVLAHPGTTYATDSFWLDIVKFCPLARLPEFVAGMCLARIFAAREREMSSWTADAVSLGAIGMVLLAIAGPVKAPYPLIHTGLLALPFSALIWAQAHGRGVIARALSLPPIVLLGEASYSLYILHVPAYDYTMHFLKHAAVPGKPFIFAFLALGASVAVLKLFEEPMRRCLRTKNTVRIAVEQEPTAVAA